MGKQICDWVAEQLIPHVVDALSAPGRGLLNAFIGSRMGRRLRLRRIAGVFEPEPDVQIVTIEREWTGWTSTVQDRTKWPDQRSGGRERGGGGGGGDGGDEEEILDRNVKPAPYLTSLIGIGEFGLRVVRSMLERAHEVGAVGTLRVVGLTPLRRVLDGAIHKLVIAVGAQVVSITPKVFAAARLKATSPLEADTYLIDEQMKRLVQATPPHAGEEPILVALRVHDVPQAAGALRSLKRSRPRSIIVPIVELKGAERQRTDGTRIGTGGLATGTGTRTGMGMGMGMGMGQQGLSDLVRLWEERVIGPSLLVDVDTGLVRQQTREQAYHFIGHELAGLCALHAHHDDNASGAEVFGQIGTEFPACGLCVESVALLPGPGLSGLDPGRLSRRQQERGRGDVGDICARIEGLLAQLIEDPASWCTAPVALSPNRTPVFVQISVPLRGGKTRFRDPRLTLVRERLERYVQDTLPGAHFSLLSANGQPDGGLSAHYFAQIGIFYGIARSDLPERPDVAPGHGQQSLDGPTVLALPPAVKPVKPRRKTTLAVDAGDTRDALDALDGVATR